MTKRQEQARESRRRLMETALSMFAMNGYERTSVHALCTRLGMADSILYHYFPGGKEELLQTLMREKIKGLLDSLERRNTALDALPLEDALEYLYQVFHSAVLQYGDVFRILLREKQLREQAAFSRLGRLMKSRQNWFPELLRSRAEKGEIQPMDYESAAETVDQVLMFHLALELTGIAASPLAEPQHRKKMIDYQVALWKRPAP